MSLEKSAPLPVDGLLARTDYEKFLLESKLTEQDVQRVTHSSDVANLGGNFVIAKSEIEGLGLFPSTNIKSGDVIGPALSDGVKTVAGRYANHSGSPNAKMVVVDKGNINLVAIRNIGDEEITTELQRNPAGAGIEKEFIMSYIVGARRRNERQPGYCMAKEKTGTSVRFN